MIKLTVIGECSGAPLASHATSCYLVEGESTSLILDMGSASLSLMKAIRNFDDIGHVVISHFHPDHSADCAVAVYDRLIAMQCGRDVKPLVFHALEERDLILPPYSGFVKIDEHSREEIGEFSVSYMKSEHPVDCLAVKVQDRDGHTLVYTADGALTGRLVSFSSGADILIAECSFYPDMGNGGAGHMNANDVCTLAVKAEPDCLVLSHLPVYGDRGIILDYVRKRYEKGEVLLASPYLEVSI